MDGLSTRDWFAGRVAVGLLHGFDPERHQAHPFYDQE